MKKDCKLTRESLERMRLGGRNKVFRYDNVAEYQSAVRNAYYIKRNNKRADGAEYKIQTSARTITIMVSLIKPELQ